MKVTVIVEVDLVDEDGVPRSTGQQPYDVEVGP